MTILFKNNQNAVIKTQWQFYDNTQNAVTQANRNQSKRNQLGKTQQAKRNYQVATDKTQSGKTQEIKYTKIIKTQSLKKIRNEWFIILIYLISSKQNAMIAFWPVQTQINKPQWYHSKTQLIF